MNFNLEYCHKSNDCIDISNEIFKFVLYFVDIIFDTYMERNVGSL